MATCRLTGSTGTHVRGFRDALLEGPRNPPQHLAKASLAELVAWAKGNPGAPRLSGGTINHKGVGSIATLLGQARRDEHIGSNPADGQQLPVNRGDKTARRPYTSKELDRTLDSLIYQPCPDMPVGGRGWAAWWLPLLSLFTGARLEELGQALVSDVKRDDGINCLEITTLDDDEQADGAKQAGKTLKSEAARRRIPLHATLIRLGFLDHIEWLKERHATRLFPELDMYRGRRTKNWSRWWAGG